MAARTAATTLAARIAASSSSSSALTRARSAALATTTTALASSSSSHHRHFSASSLRQQQQSQDSSSKPEADNKEGQQQQKDDKSKQGGGGGGGDGGGGDGIIRSPFQAFVDTLRTELQKSREMQEGMTALQGEVGKAQDSETMRAAKEAYERALLRVSLQENPRLRAAAERLKKDGGKISDAVAATLKQMEESELIKGLSNTSSWLARQLADSTAPIRQTEAYRHFSETILEALDDGASSIRIYATRDEDAKTLRARKRAIRLAKIGRSAPAVEDVEDDKYWVERDRIKAIRRAEELAEEMKAAAEYAASQQTEEESTSTTTTDDATGQDASSSSSPDAPPSKPAPAPATVDDETPLEKAPPPPPPSGFALKDPLVARLNHRAGSALVAVEGSASDDKPSTWSRVKQYTPFQDKIESFKEAYGESENPVVERLRSWGDGLKSWLFDENETAAAIRMLRRIEPSFTLDEFQRQLREYIAPELVDAMHSANRVILKQWCSERTYSVISAQIEPILKEKGTKMHGNLLDIRSIDVVQGKLLDDTEALDTGGQVPVLVVRWETTELLYFTSSNPKRIAEHQAAEAAKRKARAAANKKGSAEEAAVKKDDTIKPSTSSTDKSGDATPTDATATSPKEVVVSGSKDRADSCVYVAVLQRDEKDTDNVVTGGWKVLELIRRSEGAFL